MATTPSFGPQNTRQFEAPHERPLISLQERMMRSVREAYERYKERIPITRSRDTLVDQLKHEIKLLRQELTEKDNELRRVDLLYEQYVLRKLQELQGQYLQLQQEVRHLQREQSILTMRQTLLEKEYQKVHAIEVKVVDPHKNKVFSVIDSCIGTAHKGLTIFSAQSHASQVNTLSYNHVYQPFVHAADLF